MATTKHRGAEVGELSTAKPNSWLTPVKWADSDKSLSPMDRLWDRLDGMYPNKWRMQFANEQAIQNWRSAWAMAFAEDRITTQEVAAGLKVCRQQYDWPPSLTEFLKACRPPIEPEAAYHHAVRQMGYRHSKVAAERAREAWQHAAIYWAAAELGSDLLSCQFSQVKNRWLAALQKAQADFQEGIRTAVPAPPPMLSQPANTITPEERQEKLDKLKRELGIVGDQSQLNADPKFTEQDRAAALKKIEDYKNERGES